MNEQEAKELLRRIAESGNKGPDHVGISEEVVVLKVKKEEEKK